MCDPKEVRRFLAERRPQDAIEFLKGKLAQFRSNIASPMKFDPNRMNQW